MTKAIIHTGHRLVNVVFWLYLSAEKLGQRRKHHEGLQLVISFISSFWVIELSQPINVLLLDVLLQSGFDGLNDFPLPFWLALFVEGTRFTQAKLVAAQQYAAAVGLPIPRNVLIPRTKVSFVDKRWTRMKTK